jgi:lipoprotein-anchoring transpeptidase ErfK/SrfK
VAAKQIRRAAMVGVLTAAMAGPVAGINGLVSEASAIPNRCLKGRVVCVDKATNTLRFVVNGKTRIKMSARFGSSRTPTREGTFYVYWKNIDHVSSLYGSAMPFAQFFSGGQAIHYSSDFARQGYRARSHGCVNVRSWSGAKALYNSTRIGDKVVIYWSR